jgi:hypothetical protein
MVTLARIWRFARRWIRGVGYGSLFLLFLGLLAIWLRSFWTWDIIEYPYWAFDSSATGGYEVVRYEIRFMSGRGWIGIYVDRTIYGETSLVYPPTREVMKNFLRDVSAGGHLSWTTMDDNDSYYGASTVRLYLLKW